MSAAYRPVIAVMLDAVEPAMLARWLAAGRMPNLASFRAQAAQYPLQGIHPFTGELPTHALLTATHPAKAGYWGGFNYDARNCAPVFARAFDFKRVRPFYDYDPALKVCQFDIPKAGLASLSQGIQVLNWGAHGSYNPSVSRPAAFFGELTAKFGLHPALEKDHLEPWQWERHETLYHELIAGVRLRTEVNSDLLARGPWDIFLTGYSELHSAVHCYMHLEDTNYRFYNGKSGNGRIQNIAAEIDRSIGALIEAAPHDAAIMIFSIHGMVANAWDTLSMYMLPEFLYRLARPDRARRPQGPPPPVSYGADWWVGEVWDVTPSLGRPMPPPEEGLNFIPAVWYVPDWPKMAAFAIPGMDEGMVRINVAGRDAHGRVPPEHYERVLAYFAREIASLCDGRSGAPLVARIFRTRTNPLEDGPHLPPADLIVEWVQTPCDVAESPSVGRIGPVPLRRTGGHSRNGFAWVRDRRLTPGPHAPASPFDLGPTMLDLAGAALPSHFDGVSLLRPRAPHQNRPLFAEYVSQTP